MSGSFAGLVTASQSLAAQRYALEVTGQNISNANTPGYTRQRADLTTVGTVGNVPAMYATQRNSATGGVKVSSVSRLNDDVLDARVRTEHDKNSYASTSATQLSGVQTLFDEPSDNGLAEQLSDFWKSFTDVSTHPADLSSRSVVLQKAATVASTLNTTAAALNDLQASATAGLNQTVSDVNTMAGSLAQVNAAISIGKATGTDTNSLQDQRDQLLVKLSDAAGTQATLQPDGSATVTLGGQTLVAGNTATAVAVSGTSLTVGGAAAGSAGGKAQGLVDALTTTFPNYAAKLDAVAQAVADTANTAHEAGYDLSGTAGGPLFSGTTAASISVAITDPTKIAASSTPGGNLGGDNALAMANLGTTAGATGPDAVYSNLVTTLGSDVQRASQSATVQASVTTSVDAQQQSVAGVSYDEETANMLTYQRAYQASSRVLTTVDEMLDTLINRTGKAGL
ncbi:flagellar hook-associated protein FlgK [Jatrophihabitans telluris]|uniref:Flagellar hook-associated protein 1 n=1 Tax=Jatrophihabitans telluris TaxID=2038343 RepID=A0ABY4QWU6_9ACTN|nr:flagellar hook-associated protein FlgK [Jatrophihabitans telluris]UQX87938.1 flagellar hook-associated protein FlgK [Jatrophihabitans telluris]